MIDFQVRHLMGVLECHQLINLFIQISKTIRRKIMWSQFPPNLSCLQNNLLENNVEPVPAESKLPPKQSAGK
jgi:hypothetical protein